MSFVQARYDEPLIFELSDNSIEDTDFKGVDNLIPKNLKRENLPALPELSECQVVRHFTRLSQMNFGIDSGIYPLGSCTMKYNPKVLEEIAGYDGVKDLHPYQSEETIQGSLQIMFELQEMLKVIAGVDAVTLQPSAGAHGELLGMLIARAYHELNNEQRNEAIIPDTAHGTNPASASMAGFDVIEIPSRDGCVDLDALETVLSDQSAIFILTNPNTLGIFESEILEISEIVHEHGALLYYDGANLNSIMGKARPGDMNFDIVHLNLHKTFATPHGGGGPGSGPIGVKSYLEKFLPVPTIEFDGKKYYLNYDRPYSVGKIKSFYGNFAVLIKAYAYIKMMGRDGLKNASEIAVLNANYLKEKLKDYYELPFKNLRKHEFVLSASDLKEKGIKARDVAKRLLDYGIHAPTIYFPSLVEEALMIEPTETESKEELDRFIDAMISIAKEETVVIKSAPHNTSVARVDEVHAVRNLVLTWQMMSGPAQI